MKNNQSKDKKINMNKLHPRSVWIFFFRSLLLLIFTSFFFGPFLFGWIVSIGGAEVILSSVPGLLLIPLLILLLILFGYLVVGYIWARLTYHFWRYELTEDVLKIERGVISKKYISIPYERIQNVDIRRGLLARILRLSSLQVQTAGYSAIAGKHGFGGEGRLPGLSIDTAEELRERLIKKTKGTKSGL